MGAVELSRSPAGLGESTPRNGSPNLQVFDLDPQMTDLGFSREITMQPAMILQVNIKMKKVKVPAAWICKTLIQRCRRLHCYQ